MLWEKWRRNSESYKVLRAQTGEGALLTRDPVFKTGKVGPWRRLPRVEHLHRPAGHHHYAKPSGRANRLLTRRERDIDSPLIELELLATHTAHAVHDDQRLGAHAAH